MTNEERQQAFWRGIRIGMIAGFLLTILALDMGIIR